MNTFVDFLGEFEKPDPSKKVPGGDLTEVLIEGLKKEGFKILKVLEDYFAFFITVIPRKRKYEIMVSLDSLHNERWEVSCLPKLGFFFRLLGKREKEEFRKLLKTINETLKRNPKVRDMRWFPNYDDPDRNKKRKYYPDPF